MTISDKAKQTAERYRGAIAQGYEGKRKGQPKWEAEDRIVRSWLAVYERETPVIDVPFGTGRFIPIYLEKGFRVQGYDVNPDMLAIASQNCLADKRDVEGRGYLTPATVTFKPGNVFDLPDADKTYDVALCIRLLNLIDARDMQKALSELQRVTRKDIILNLRVWHAATKYRNPQRIEDLEAALQPGWIIADNAEIHEPDFRMIRLTCSG